MPDEFKEHKILSIADGKYLETNKLVTSDYVDFSASHIQKTKTFCSPSGWSDLADFDRAFLRVVSELKPDSPLQNMSNLKEDQLYELATTRILRIQVLPN